MSFISGVHADSTQPAVVNTQGLSQDERSFLENELKTYLALTASQVALILSSWSPEQARSYLQLSNGQKSISKNDAIEKWGLTNEEANKLFGQSDVIGVFDNPFGDLFLRFLMLSYTLGLDIKRLISQVTTLRFDEAVSAAKDRLSGALVQFICGLVAGALFLGFGIGCLVRFSRSGKSDESTDVSGLNKNRRDTEERQPLLYGLANSSSGRHRDLDTAASPAKSADKQSLSHNKQESPGVEDVGRGHPLHPLNQWMGSPIVAQQLTAPITSGGQYGEAVYSYQASVHDANVQLNDSVFQQLLDAWQGTQKASDIAYAGL